MDVRELELYKEPDFIRTVEENLGRAPAEIALDRSLSHAREVATRVKYLQKARTKLPSYYQARCIVTGRAYEQSSGERSAFSKQYTGSLCIDLTCGLGVDSYALSRGFERVITVEPDPLLAETARYNFGLLGANNIEVVNSTAEDFLASRPELKADLIYADPDRRDGSGKRMSALEDCSPNLFKLLPTLKDMSDRVVVKLSPLFDVKEALRVFGPTAKVTAVSDSGECKEVLVETGNAVAGPLVAARILGRGEVVYDPSQTIIRGEPKINDISSFCLLAVPDVALVNTGTARKYYTEKGWHMPSAEGYAFGNESDDIYGRIYRITSAHRYSSKALKPLLKEKGIGRLNIMLRGFPQTAGQICKELGIKEGGNFWAAFTTYQGERLCLFLEPV